MAIAQSTTTNNNKPTIKFMLSYGGRILPRYPDGKLRYHGGQTRVLSVDRSISFSDLVAKLSEMCGKERIMSCLRCQLPNEDLDALVSITSDEDLANIVEEYDRFATGPTPQKPLKIRAFLSIARNARRLCNDPNSSMSSDSSSSSSSSLSSNEDSTSPSSAKRFAVSANKPPIYPNSSLGKYRSVQARNLYQCRHHVCVNHWQ